MLMSLFGVAGGASVLCQLGMPRIAHKSDHCDDRADCRNNHQCDDAATYDAASGLDRR